MCPEYLHLEDSKVKLEPIQELVVDGQTITTDEEILEELQQFYVELYSGTSSSSVEAIDEFLEGLPLGEVPEELMDQLGAPVSEVEVQEALEKIRVSKAPGPDGLVPEFYKRFTPI